MFHIQFIPYCIYIHERLYLHGVAVRLLWKSNRCRRKSCTAYNRYNTQHTLFESQSGFQIFSRRCSLPHIYANAQGKPKPKVALKNSILMRRISNVHLLISLSLAAFFALFFFFLLYRSRLRNILTYTCVRWERFKPIKNVYLQFESDENIICLRFMILFFSVLENVDHVVCH